MRLVARGAHERVRQSAFGQRVSSESDRSAFTIPLTQYPEIHPSGEEKVMQM